VRVPEYALDNQPDIQFASVFGLTTKFSNAPGQAQVTTYCKRAAQIARNAFGLNH
jgi:hypothetical protein